MNVNENERKAEQVSKLLTAEKFTLAKLGRGELGREEAANLETRINTAVVTFVREALEDRKLAEKLVKTFEKAIENRTTASPRIAVTLSKVMAMWHDMEFNGHRPSEEKLDENLAALKPLLNLDSIEEKYSELKRKSERKQAKKNGKEKDNEMYA